MVLPFETFRRLVPEQAEACLSDEDLAALVLATHDPKEETWPATLVNRLLDGESPLRVYRQYRGLSQKTLAEKAGCTPNYISQLESGRRVMSASMARLMASLLDVDVDDLVPEQVAHGALDGCEETNDREQKSTGPVWVDEDDAPDLSTPEWAAILDRTPVKRGRPPLARAEQSTTVRLDPDILEYLRSGDPDWPTRLNTFLRKAIAAEQSQKANSLNAEKRSSQKTENKAR